MAARKPVTLATVRRIALKLPEVEEGTSYGTPAWKVKGKMFARLKEDRKTLVVRVSGLDEQEMLLEVEPEVLFLTDHYRGYPYVLVRLPRVDAALLKGLLTKAWRVQAPKKLVLAIDEASKR